MIETFYLQASILASSTNLKRIQAPHSLFRDFRAEKTSTTCWSGCRVQEWVQVWAPSSCLAITPKASPVGNQRFWLQFRCLSPWGRALRHSLGWLESVGWVSKNTGHFQVGCSWRWPCWQQQAHLRKECYHSCYSDWVLEPKKFKWLLNLGQWLVTDNRFLFHVKRNCFSREMKFSLGVRAC